MNIKIGKKRDVNTSRDIYADRDTNASRDIGANRDINANKDINADINTEKITEIKKIDNKAEKEDHRTEHDFFYYVMLFFVLAFAGWIWEVLLSYITRHAFINRGVYRGPYLPIYGVGGVLLCFLLRTLRKRPLTVFLLSTLLCSVLEYLTSFYLERHWGIRWWDYSGHFLNINGRICLLGAVTFGLGGTALVCFLLPLYEKIYRKIPRKWILFLCLLFLAVFIADATYCAMNPNTGRGISF